MKTILRQTLYLATLFLATNLAHATETNLFNLNEKKPKPRFKVTEKVWPENVGEGHLCLWKDDKLAAISFTVDDNIAPEIDWWLEQSKTYGFPVTWFLITGRVDGGNPFFGTWEQYKTAHAAGHGMESHTVTHLHRDHMENWSIEREYQESAQKLQEVLPGSGTTLAYPGGKNKKLNSREVAAPIYRAARGGVGLINPASAIDYLNVNTMGKAHTGDGKGEWADLNNLIKPDSYKKGRFYRGWAVLLAHKVDKAQFESIFAFVKEHQDDLWLGLFADVARYGQQRDTATLKTQKSSSGEITIDLTDRMDDSYFTEPLTVKVRIPNAWKKLTAEQNGSSREVQRIEHNGNAYALVAVVPDQGTASLRGK